MKYFDELIPQNIPAFLKKNKIEFILILISSLFMVGSLLTLYALNKNDESDISFKQTDINEEAKSSQFDESMIVVDLSGAVQKPDSYELKVGSRLKDLLAKANGLSKEADRDFFSRNFNLAKVLIDQEKIHIPTSEEVEDGLFTEAVFVVNSSVGSGQVAGTATSTSNSAKVNINTATTGELDKLPGIGPVTVDKIISSRPYTSTQELLDKKVVTKSQWEKIKEMIMIN